MAKTTKSTAKNTVEEPSKVQMTAELKTAILNACALLSQYQRLLESQGKASSAKKVKDTKDTLWELCQNMEN